jgi:hypothetical protein
MALSIGDRGYVLETGRLVAEGNPETLWNNDEIRALSAVGRLDIEKSSFVSLSQAKGELKARQGVGGNHQSGIRNPDSPDPLAFWRRYSAWVTSARFSSETDFCSFAILIASQNEASI